MKKKFIKGIVASLSLLVATGLASCDAEETPVVEEPLVMIVPSSVPKIEPDKVEEALAKITLRVYMPDGTTTEVKVTSDMLKSSDIEAIKAMKADQAYLLEITYEGKVYTTNLWIDAPDPVVATFTISYQESDIPGLLKETDAKPAESYLAAWYWGVGNGGKWNVPTVDESGVVTATVDIGTTGIIWAYMENGKDANWDNKIDQTNDLRVGFNSSKEAIVFEGTEVSTGDSSSIALNLTDNKTMPEDGTYDLYVWSWGGAVDTFTSVDTNGKFYTSVGASGALYLLMPKGSLPNWDNKLCQTSNYSIASGVCTLIAS